MKVQNATCPPDPVLADFGLGKLDAASSDTVSQHLETCADCRQRVAGLSADSFVGRLRNVPGHGAGPGQAAGRTDRTFIAGESASAAAGSETPSDESRYRPAALLAKAAGGMNSALRPAATTPSTIESAPPELANHPDYELLKELGQGGMGTVYLAKNRMMDRLEVLKVVSKSLLERPEALERFQQEIRSAAKLAHPNIVAAYTVLRPGDLLVFAMEYVRGQDLSQVVKARGQLPVAHAAFYTHQVALGLQHAHEKGMVHRDIKPNNLMLAVEGKKHIVKILDFGLSKATSEKGAEAGLTKSGQVLGTPDYMSPEQTLNAQRADIRADIYSLGCTLYHLLTGGPPFQEDSLYGILDAHQKRDARPLNLVRPDVPVELAAAVAKMMAKDPAKRYQTPAEVARALVSFFKPGQSAPPPADAGQSQGGAETAHGTSVATPATPIAPIPVPFALPVTPPPAAITDTTPVPMSGGMPPFSVSVDTRLPPGARRRGWWSSLPPWHKMTAVMTAGAAAVILLGVVFLVQTMDGVIRVEINDEQIEVAIKGTDIVLKHADNGRDIKLSPGEKTLIIERGDFKFETDKLILKKGETITVAVTLLGGQVEVRQGDNVIGEGKLPPDASPATVAGSEDRLDGLPDLDHATDPSRGNAEEAPTTEIVPAIIERQKKKADYDAIATGTWVPVMRGETELQDNWAAVPQHTAGDVILRARVKKVSGQHLSLLLRRDEKRKTHYGAWFNGGNWFGVFKSGDGSKAKGDLGQWRTPNNFDDYFEFAFSAVGESLTIYADGKRIGEVRDADYRSGSLGIRALRGRSLFQDVEIMVLDKQPPAADNTLTGDEKKAGWTLLFDGKSLAGWTTSNQEPSKTQIEAGAVNPHKCGAYMLIHEQTWENFELALDFKLSKGCNSGIFIRTYPLKPRPGKDVGLNGIEVALDDTTGTGYTDSGAIYGLAKPKRNAMKPVGEWNHAVILCDKNLITVELNGDEVTTMDLDQFTAPNRRPDGSPHMFDVTYKDHPRRGYIGLQDHGSPCWFKNIKLKELK